MRLPADLHTHTVASGHAYSTVRELVHTAARREMELIAVTDHGPAVPGGPHPWYFANLKALPSIVDGVRILKGIEANIVSPEGALDLDREVLERLDFVAVGFHPTLGFDELDIGSNTRALLGAIADPLVDMVTHPGNSNFPVDREAVVEAAADRGVILELNDFTFVGSGSRSGSEDLEAAFAEAAVRAGAPIAINSDAHYHTQVGVFEGAGPIARGLGLTEDDFVNSGAQRVLDHLLARRERPQLDIGGEW